MATYVTVRWLDVVISGTHNMLMVYMYVYVLWYILKEIGGGGGVNIIISLESLS